MKSICSSTNQKVGVFPAHELSCRKRLFYSLEQAFPVTFIGYTEERDNALSAVISFSKLGSTELLPIGVPVMRLPTGGGSETTNKSIIHIANDHRLDQVLRGRRLTELRLGAIAPLSIAADTIVLASVDAAPIWCVQDSGSGVMWISALAIRELDEKECLRDRLRDGNFASLLPLVHFLKDFCSRDGWSEPPLRATIVIDDPNLHSPRYGYLQFPKLALHADRHDYHIAMAMIPFDSWYAHPKAIQIFRNARTRLSLLIHGNNHVSHELAKFRSDDEAMSCLAQALRRVKRFEKRSNVLISRVIAPPHGVCSQRAMITMLRLGFEGICVSRPYPWLQGPPREMPLAGWCPADLVAGGLPVIPRYHLNAPRDDLVFRAFLGQPLILYGHHDDASSGMEAFSAAAEQIRSLGEVQWCSLEQIVRSNFATRRTGKRIYVRNYSNNLDIRIPDGVSELVLTSPPVHGEPEKFTVSINNDDVSVTDTDEESGCRFARCHVSPGKTSIALRHMRLVTAESISSPPWRLWPIARRVLTEGRDRIRPALGRY